MKGYADDAGSGAGLPPARPEAIRCPWTTVRADKDHRTLLPLRRSVERRLERRAHGDGDTHTGLALPQVDAFPVVSGPREFEQIALTLTRPQREQQRQVQVRR